MDIRKTYTDYLFTRRFVGLGLAETYAGQKSWLSERPEPKPALGPCAICGEQH